MGPVRGEVRGGGGAARSAPVEASPLPSHGLVRLGRPCSEGERLPQEPLAKKKNPRYVHPVHVGLGILLGREVKERLGYVRRWAVRLGVLFE